MDFQEENITKNEAEILMMSPLTWAYVGDSVYEQYIRTYLNSHKMHINSIKFVKASAQANLLQKLNEEVLTEDEKDIVRRGRNTQSHHLPKHASVEEYMYSTAFEGLIGFLYLTKQNDRLKLILEKCIEYVNNQEI